MKQVDVDIWFTLSDFVNGYTYNSMSFGDTERMETLVTTWNKYIGGKELVSKRGFDNITVPLMEIIDSKMRFIIDLY